MLLPVINNIAEICAQKGINHVVISPGSRSAALTLAFARHVAIHTKVIPDERAAGFIALGMAQQLEKPLALVCTSGSAAYNLAPAVVEAYFQQVPLLIFTADRPQEWIHQQDGQTIYQREIYGKHVKKYFDFPADFVHGDTRWYAERILNEAINLSQIFPNGPVHINVPIGEPFYPTAQEKISYDRHVKVIERLATEPTLSVTDWHRIQHEFESYDKILIAVGQLSPDNDLWQILHDFSNELGVPVVGDIIANVPFKDTFITKYDIFLRASTPNLEILQPDLLITIGDSFISKNLKFFLRKHPPQNHWHIKASDELIDTFQTLTLQIPVQPTYFFKKLLEDLDYQQFVQNDPDDDERSDFKEQWLQTNRKATRSLHQFLKEQLRWNEFVAVAEVLEHLPNDCIVHLANSMPVRYANLIGATKNIEVFANRGTSGIDGCTSTAVGAALMTNKLVFLITGDVAFFYDRNALWHPHLPPNLRIVLFNNSGGNIFRLIDGPSDQPELEQYFETRHHTTAQHTAADNGLHYFEVKNMQTLQQQWQDFVNPAAGKPQLIEIFTDPIVNGEVFEAFKKIKIS